MTSRDKLIDDALESAGEHRAERDRRDDACPHCGGELTFLREIAPARIPRGPPRLKLAIPG